ncbi:hypothetical protein D3C72_1206060 [compost metagenome]
MLIGGDRCGGEFGTRAQALNDPYQDEDDRCPDADGGVAGDQANQGGAYTHQAEGNDQHLLASEAVTQVTEQDAAKGSGNKADGEGGKGQQRGHGRIARVEEHLGKDNRRHGGVKVEVIPLQHRAEDGGRRDLTQALFLLFRGFCRGRSRLMYRHKRFPFCLCSYGVQQGFNGF